MKKRDLRKEREQLRRSENKRFILRAAERIFARKGFSLATMDEIAEEAQFSKATIYQYFKSKREIFFEIIYKFFEEVHQKIKNVQLKKTSAEEKLRELIFYIGSYYHKKKNIARIIIMEKSLMKKLLHVNSKEQTVTSSPHPPIPDFFMVKLNDIFQVMCEIIEEGVKTGEFRKVDVLDASSILGAMIRGFYFRGPLRNKEYSIEESTDLLHSFFLNGIKKVRHA